MRGHFISFDELGRLARQLREQRGVAVRELAGAIGADPGNLSRAERGDSAYYLLAVRALEYLVGVPIEEGVLVAGLKEMDLDDLRADAREATVLELSGLLEDAGIEVSRGERKVWLDLRWGEQQGRINLDTLDLQMKVRTGYRTVAPLKGQPFEDLVSTVRDHLYRYHMKP